MDLTTSQSGPSQQSKKVKVRAVAQRQVSPPKESVVVRETIDVEDEHVLLKIY
jgi:hypothetical protein